MLIAGPNLTLDRTGTIAALRPREVLRFERVVGTPGGKEASLSATRPTMRDLAARAGVAPPPSSPPATANTIGALHALAVTIPTELVERGSGERAA